MDGLRTIICVLFAGAGLACSLGAGCTANDGGTGDPYYADGDAGRSFDDSDGYGRRYDEPAPPPPVQSNAGNDEEP